MATTTQFSTAQGSLTATTIVPNTNPLVVLQGTTTAYSLTVKLTNGSTASGDPQKYMRVYISNLPYTISNAQAQAQAAQGSCYYMDVKPAAQPSGVAFYTSPVLPRTGDTVYVWYDVPNWPAVGSATIDSKLVEIP